LLLEGLTVRRFGCDAILFDLDGVLVDSTAVVVRVWSAWAERQDIEVDRIMEVAHGRRSAETIALVAPHLDAGAEARELERSEVADLDGIVGIEGASGLLASLPEDGWTVVTSGSRSLATRRLEHVGLPLPERFVAAEDVEEGKPHPDAYLKGAQVVGVPAERCLVVEDAPSGVQAARKAGMAVVAVTTTHDRKELFEADAVVNSLAEIHPVAGSGSRFELRLPT
jgi:sugar-phosphatase